MNKEQCRVFLINLEEKASLCESAMEHNKQSASNMAYAALDPSSANGLIFKEEQRRRGNFS